MGTYLTYSDLWPTASVSLKDLEADFEFFDAQDLAHSLAQLGFLVEEGIDESARAHNLEVIAPFFPASWMNKIRLWLTTGKANTITHRYLVPGAVQQILLRRPSARDGVLVAKDPHRFGAFLLRMNQFTERDYNEAIADGSRDPDDTRHARAALFRYLFYYDSPNWGSLVGRYWALMFEGARAVASRPDLPQYDLASAFADHVGVPLFDGMAYLMLIAAYYLGDAKSFAKGRQFLIGLDAFRGLNSDGHRLAGRKVIQSIYYRWDDYASAIVELCKARTANWTQFQLFYERPFIGTSDQLMFPIDKRLLRIMLTEGVYWQVVATLSRSQSTRLNQYFGGVVEWYVSALVKNATQRGMRDRAWLDWESEIEVSSGQPKPDIIVRSGSTMFVVEVTTVALAPSVAVGFDLGAIEKAYSDLWFRKKQSGKQRGKLLQLGSAIEGIRAGSIRCRDGADGAPSRIVPVLVTLRSQPRHPLLAPYVRELMRSHELGEEFADNIQLLNLEEFEQIVELQARGRRWEELLDEKEASPSREWNWTHFLWATGLDQQRHELVDGWSREAMERYKAFLDVPLGGEGVGGNA
jgi:hypothetical protein